MDDQGFIDSTADLLARIQRAWDALWATLDGLSEEQLLQSDAGGWSIKDNLAHLTAWERYLMLHHLQGRPLDEALGLDKTIVTAHIDEINAGLFAANCDRALADVVESAHAVHQQLVACLADVPFEQLLRVQFTDSPLTGPVLDRVVGNTFDHYEEHMDAIRALAGETNRS